MNKKALRWIIFALIVLGISVALFFVLRPYFAGEKIVHPEVFRIGNFSIRWYGLLIALSFIPGIYVAYKMALNWSINPDHVFNLAIICAPLGLIFARLFYCALNLPYYSKYPAQILYLWQGGLSIYGVIFGGILGVLIYSLVGKVNFLRLMDLGAVPLLLGQAIGRWGNFFNQELFGYPTDLPWKMYISPEYRPQKYMAYNYFHPTFLYESIYNFILFGVLYSISKKKDLKPGVIVSLYFIGYGTFRFFLEFVRIEPAAVWFFSWGQVASLAAVLIGSLMLFFITRSKPVQAELQAASNQGAESISEPQEAPSDEKTPQQGASAEEKNSGEIPQQEGNK
ncbi:MAG: prolipoprotein diacylglyceryl transferase [Caldiserica bacterium]|jgi:phosphatidylglycerol:prolipoprotein diacylglycerol transferase|nr:prolipoprotein diacylglyceryl transferase [Caldisericota bacterium]MDH7561936.1 prolipoprotein diacylglyceryl transferase [Caldisericota bacterium]